MDTFFFIAKNNGKLNKCYIKSGIKNLQTSSYLDTINNYFKTFMDSDKDPEILKYLYIHGVNSKNIYFKDQILNPSIMKNDQISDIDLEKLLEVSHIFFRESAFLDIDIESESFNDYRFILNPKQFNSTINDLIYRCYNYLDFIENNYEILIGSDLQHIKSKNNLLKSLSLDQLVNIKDYIKTREKTEYIIFELDIETTNVLLSLLDIKYNKLSDNDDVISICKIISEKKNILKNIDNFLNLKMNRNFKNVS